MKSNTTTRKNRNSAEQKEKTAVPPATILGKDLKRVATCTGDGQSRYGIKFVELSPLGLAATDGKVLCALNAPGWPYHCYLEPEGLRGVQNDARLAINGNVQFTGAAQGEAPTVVAHQNPDEVHFPKWQSVLPEACFMQPFITVNAAQLKRLLAALQRSPESSVTLYARPDDGSAPMMLCNEAGDLGMLTSVVQNEEEPVRHFPSAIYQAFNLDAQPLPLVISPRRVPQPVGADGSAGGLLSGGQ